MVAVNTRLVNGIRAYIDKQLLVGYTNYAILCLRIDGIGSSMQQSNIALCL